jgi:heme/copper-type cytochrome/quinol oxidase subunit 2
MTKYTCVLLLVAQWSGLEIQAAPLLPKHAPNAAINGDMLPSFLAHGAVKPPRGMDKMVKQAMGGTNDTAHNHHSGLKCGVTEQVGSGTDKYERCPDSCAFFAQNRKDSEHCTFLCVPQDDCAKWNPNKPIADTIKSSRTCRGPKVKFCTEANIDGTDSCRKCQFGFEVHIGDGQCYFQYWISLMVFLLVVTILVLVVTVWIVDWCRRETINPEGVTTGISHRARAKILMPKSLLPEGETQRRVWDIDTNMCKVSPIPGKRGVPAGPGMMLHFNFQAFFIFWPLVLAIVWTIIACFHNELFTLGTRKFGTPRHNCILVAYGYETQQRLMWTKNLFLVIAYLFSFVTFLFFSVRQLRLYQTLDKQEKSMKDFAVELTGLPEIPGDYLLDNGGGGVEKFIKEHVANKTQHNVVGVSVAWNFTVDEEMIMNAIAKGVTKREIELGYLARAEIGDPTAGLSSMSKKLYGLERSLLGYPATQEDEKPEEELEEELIAKLKELRSSPSAFVVFDTEEGKDAAVKLVEESPDILDLPYGDTTYPLKLNQLECEPATVNWQNFGDTGPHVMLMNGLKAIMKYYVPALSIWFFAFYVPYAASLYYFNYDNGAQLPGYYSLVFTMVVVGGNATMYVICDLIGDECGFQYKDSKQTAYMIMYLIACMINVFLDMAVTYMTALKIMRGLDFRNYFGKRLDDIHSFTEQFETYAMQRSLAENTYAYAFPSTMLVPFLLEPIVTILVPYQLGKLIVRTHKEVQGLDAGAFMVAFDFDLGRYADILLNVFLAILIFWFPGGYIWSLFYGMFISHIVIYLFDHWRVLHVIPTVKIVSKQVDWWAQVCMIGCCGMIMGCLVFKLNCETYAPGGFCLQDYKLIETCTLAGLAHCVVHMLLLLYLVPLLCPELDDDQDANRGATYKSVAQFEPKSWFSVNPVHCLRSKLIFNHKVHCQFAAVGKDHLLEINEEIACYFKDGPAENNTEEDMTWKALMNSLKRRESSDESRAHYFPGKEEDA